MSKKLGYILGGAVAGVTVATAGCGYMLYGDKGVSMVPGGAPVVFILCEISFGAIGGAIGAVGGTVLAGVSAVNDAVPHLD